MMAGEFVPDLQRDGWVFPDYYISGVVFRTCPFCGGDLPTIAQTLTDGSEGAE
jgi:hypothetical protein